MSKKEHKPNKRKIDFLIKGQSRIHSISLIHQNLYETGYCNTINLQNYIENIVQNLSQIYNSEIDIEINTNETILDVDTAIPFGLIITELVCNAFKHAFKDKVKNHEKIIFSPETRERSDG
jgi:two-component sensor histidine kinase